MASHPTTTAQSPMLKGADEASRLHLIASIPFLALGALLIVGSLFAMVFPAAFPLVYGRIRSLGMAALMLGWLTNVLVGGAYYALPRLTGARLGSERLARVGFLGLNGATAAGMVLVAIGLGDGREPFAFPWYGDILVFGALSIPALVMLLTLRHREEKTTFPTIWFVGAGLGILPLSYVVGNIPGLGTIPSTLGDLHFTGTFPTSVMLTLGVGLMYFAVVRKFDLPLASRSLASVGVWSFVVASGWIGIATQAQGPFPGWLAGITALLGFALPIGMLATAVNLVSTVGKDIEKIRDEPIALTAMAGISLGLVVTSFAAFGSLRSAATLVGLTPYWEGIIIGLLLGVGSLLVASFTYEAYPNVMGREVASKSLARSHVRFTVIGIGGAVISMVIAGLATGFSWSGGGFTSAFQPFGEGWAQATASGRLFTGIALLFSLVGLVGIEALALNQFQTITQGHAVSQEVLVIKTTEDEQEPDEADAEDDGDE